MAFLMQLPFILNAQITHTVSFATSDLTITTTIGEDNITYNKINVKDLFPDGDVASPELPIRFIKLIIPTDKDAGIVVINQSTKLDYTLTNKVYPIQPAQPISISSFPPDFVAPNPLIYNSSTPYPADMVKIVNQGYFDGKNKIVTIAICPFKYYPTLNKLEYYTNINFTVSFVNSSTTGVQVNKRLISSQKLYDGILSTMVDNPENIAQYQVKALNLTDSIKKSDDTRFYQYVIITNNCYRDNFNDFVQWKKRKGLDIGVVTIEDIESCGYTGDLLHTGHEIYDEAGKIRQYLHDGYANSPVGTFYALLAWKIDVEPLPIRYGYAVSGSPTSNIENIIPTDTYFTDFNGDWNGDGDPYYGEPRPDDSVDFNPEIFVGRLLINAPQDIANWTQKIKIYEQNPGNGDYDYLTKYFRTHADGLDISSNSLSYLSMFQHTVIQEYPTYYSIYDTNGMVVGSNPPIYGNTKGAQIIEKMNNSHYGFISWYNHGGTGDGESGCAPMTSGINDSPNWKIQAEDAFDYPGSQSEINNGLDKLTNFDYPSIVYTISCDLTPYDKTKSFGNQVPNSTLSGRNCGESFTVNNLAGGVAFLGNTRAGKVGHSEELFNFFAKHIKSAHDVPYLCFNGHLGIAEGISKASSGNSYVNFSHNLIGCPETEMWSAIPTIFNASVTPSMILLNDTKDVTINIYNLTYLKDAIICLYNGNEIFQVATVTGSSSNQANYTFTNINPQCLNNIQVTITAYNYLPYMTDILVSDCIYSSSPLGITQNTIWNESSVINQNVIVKNGATLTIAKNVKKAFNSQAKIIVEPGSKLIVDGATLTNSCNNDLWQGIELQGNTNLSQIPANQGYVEFKNGARIEYANTAIYTAKLNPNGTDDPNGYGGIVKVDNTTFYNNYSSILIKNYYNPFGAPQTNQSTISNSTFEVNQPYYDLVETPPGFINLALVTNVKIQNNVLKNTYTAAYSNRNYGIYSTDASYYLSNNNQFIGLKYGVKSMNTIPSFTPTIDHCTFTNCWRGIYLSGVTNPTVTFNTMSVPSDNNNCYGLYLDNCPTFNVQENTFAGKAENRNGDFGIIINNCGETSKKIYNNVFTYINTGTQAQNQNKNASGSTGLQILCNTYTNTNNDITVMSNQTGVVGIAQYQGRLGPQYYDPAGNIFSHNEMDFTNSVLPNITYYHHNPSSNPYVLPNPISGNITLSNTNIIWYDKLHCCPSEFTEGLGDIAGLKSSISSSQNLVNTTNAQLQTLVDGGNTTLLEMQVDNSLPPQALQLRNKLMSKSPYLSDSVMVSAIENEGGLPPSMLTQVLVANPSGAKSPDVMDKLDGRENLLPTYMMNQILAGQNRIADKEKLETKVCYYTLQRDMAWDKISRIYKNDSIHPWANDSLIALFGSDPRLATKYELVFAKMAKNQSNEAMQLLNSLPQNFVMEESQNEEYNDYVVLAEIYADLKENNKTWQEMSNAQKQALQVLADKQQNRADMYAINIMRTIGIYSYIEPILQAGSGGGKMLYGIGANTKNQSSSSDIQFKVYPNPAKDYFIIDYFLLEGNTSAIIGINDITGKLVKNINIHDKQNQIVVETKDLQSGIYYISLMTNNSISKTVKIAIFKQ